MLKIVLSSLVAAFLLTGCHFVNSGISAPVNLTSSAVDATSNSVGSKKGEATCQAILFIAFGDCSIATAAKNGGISKIHTVDTKNFSILGIYSKQTLEVTGE